MLEIQDRFVNFLMTMFYDELNSELKGYGLKLAKAIEEEDKTNIDFYMKFIKDTRGILSDLSDENMTPRDFVHLIFHKYGAMTDA